MKQNTRRWVVKIVILVAVLTLAREGCLSIRETARLASCRPRVLFVACQEYAKSHEGMFPALSPRFGRLMFDAEGVQRIGDLYDQRCESDLTPPPEIFKHAAQDTPANDWSYVYLGYLLENEAQGMAFVDEYHRRAGKDGAFEQDMPVPVGSGNCGTDRLFRIREIAALPLELPCLKDHAATIPVIIEWPENHRKGGKVVFLDGHTELRAYLGEFPMTPEFISALRTIDAELHPSTPPAQGHP